MSAQQQLPLDAAQLAAKKHEYFLRLSDDVHTLRIALALVKKDPLGGEHPYARFARLEKESSVPPSPPVALQRWSLNEDRLLVTLDSNHSDLLGGYRTMHNLNPATYPKVVTDENALRTRLYDLSATMPARLQFLKSTADPHSPEARNAPSPAAPAFAARLSLTTTDLFSSSSGSGSPKSSSAPEDVKLTLKTRDGAVEQCLCHSKLVSQQSPILSELIRQSGESQGGLREVTLDEYDPLYASVLNVGRVFGLDNLRRFIQFCRDPSVVDAKVAMDAAASAVRQAEKERCSTYRKSVEKERDTQLGRLQKELDECEASVHKAYQESMQKDFELIRRIYEGHIRREVAASATRFQQELQETARF